MNKRKMKGTNLFEQYPDAFNKVLEKMEEDKKKMEYLLTKGYTREDFTYLSDKQCEELYLQEKAKDGEK